TSTVGSTLVIAARVIRTELHAAASVHTHAEASSELPSDDLPRPNRAWFGASRAHLIPLLQAAPISRVGRSRKPKPMVVSYQPYCSGKEMRHSKSPSHSRLSCLATLPKGLRCCTVRRGDGPGSPPPLAPVPP